MKKTVTKHKSGTRRVWIAAELQLLKAEKELTRRSDDFGRPAAGTAVGSDLPTAFPGSDERRD